MKSILFVLAVLLPSIGCGASTDTIKDAKLKIVELRIIHKANVAQTQKRNNQKARIENFRDYAVCSGALVSSSGHILTARHCADNVDRIDVVTADGQEYEAQVVATSKVHDLALIHIDRYNTPFFRLAGTVEQGQKVYVLGSPLGLTGTLNTGIVAKLNGDVNLIDCSALPGNSGCPAFNENGELVGVVTAGFIVLYGTTHLNIMQSLDAIVGFALSLGR